MSDPEPKVAIIDCGSARVPDIARAVEQAGARAFVISPHDLRYLDRQSAAAIIISGKPELIRDTGTQFLTDFEILHTLALPVLGICFGHQVIGLLHGAEISTGKEDREMRPVSIVQKNPLISGPAHQAVFQQDHVEEVTVPVDFLHLASSSHCSNEAMMHPDLPVFGVQFHPESSGKPGRQVIRNFLSFAGCIST